MMLCFYELELSAMGQRKVGVTLVANSVNG